MVKQLRLCAVGDEAGASIEEQVAASLELRLGGLELRTVNGLWLHELDSEEFRAVEGTIKRSGLTVPAIASSIGNWGSSVMDDVHTDLEILRVLCARGEALSCQSYRIMSYPNAGLAEPEWRQRSLEHIARLVEEAEKLGVVLLHENCAGWAGVSASHTLDLLASIQSPALETLFDVGNCVVYGMKPVEFLEQTLQSVRHVHVKDAKAGPDGEFIFTMPFDGDAGLRECLAVLQASPYEGWIAFEPHVAFMPHLGSTSDPAHLRSSFRAYVDAFRADTTVSNSSIRPFAQ